MAKAKDSKDFYRLNTLDIAVIVLIVLFATGVILHTSFGSTPGTAKVVEATIYRDGKIYKQVKVDEDQELPLLDGKTVVQIQQGRLRILKSDCPRQICVNKGWIHRPGETIVCVPYRTLIELKGSDSLALDAVVS